MKKVLQQLRQYRKDTFLCIGLTALEVLMEILLPFITARLIDEGLEKANLPVVYRYGIIMVVTLNIFNRVFQKYDDLNASVQENISAIRVVKAFVREGYENRKFSKASGNLYKMFVKAEGLLANADCIMVMEQGRIIERGTHDELIEKKGKYYQLYTGNLAEETA